MAEGFGLEPMPRVRRTDLAAAHHSWISLARAADEIAALCSDVDQREIEQSLWEGAPMLWNNLLYVPSNVVDHLAATVAAHTIVNPETDAEAFLSDVLQHEMRAENGS